MLSDADSSQYTFGPGNCLRLPVALFYTLVIVFGKSNFLKDGLYDMMIRVFIKILLLPLEPELIALLIILHTSSFEKAGLC